MLKSEKPERAIGSPHSQVYSVAGSCRAKDVLQMTLTPRIMLVDDEGIALKRLRRILEKQGYRVSSYTHPEGALKQMEEKGYDLVVTDMKMPGMDGMDLMIAIKTRFPATEVIMMSGYATIDNAIEATREGAFHYLEKPFTPEQFLETVEKALEQQRLRAQVIQEKDEATAGGARPCHYWKQSENKRNPDPDSPGGSHGLQYPDHR